MDIARRAIELAMEYEKKEGRNPKDVSKDKKHVGYDILSEGRRIEVKGFSTKNSFFQFNPYNLRAFEKPDFYLYVIFDINKEPKLIEYNRIELAKKLERSSISPVFEVPLRNADFGKGISLTDLLK